jgi:hypothetical protein
MSWNYQYLDQPRYGYASSIQIVSTSNKNKHNAATTAELLPTTTTTASTSTTASPAKEIKVKSQNNKFVLNKNKPSVPPVTIPVAKPRKTQSLNHLTKSRNHVISAGGSIYEEINQSDLKALNSSFNKNHNRRHNNDSDNSIDYYNESGQKFYILRNSDSKNGK